MSTIYLALIVLFAALILSHFLNKTGSLDIYGIIFANLLALGLLVFNKIPELIIILCLFVFVEASTKIRSMKLKAHKGRKLMNIVGNIGMPLIGVLLNEPSIFIGGIAVAMADTLSSEIGMLSKKNPVMITSLKRVKKGTDGAISLLGTSASLLGGIIIGLLYLAFYEASLPAFTVIALVGPIGSIVDSLLGATLEQRKIIGNNLVNFAATTAGSIICYIAFTLI